MYKKLILWAKEVKKDTLALYLVMKRNDVNWFIKILIGIVVGYALSPIDLIPDFIPVLGFIDDIILIPIGIYLLVKLIPNNILEECKMQSEDIFKNKKPVSRIAGYGIVLIWIALIVIISWRLISYMN